MLKNYCTSCGKATEFTTLVPIFCSFCGSPFNKSVGKQDVVEPIISIEDRIDDPNVALPQIDKLDVVIEQPPAKLTFGNLAFQKPTEKIQRPPSPKISRKRFLEEWKLEAGPGSKEASIQIGGDK